MQEAISAREQGITDMKCLAAPTGGQPGPNEAPKPHLQFLSHHDVGKLFV
jgi:CxxC motif-containing protein (DUF1111 family)